MIKMEDIKSKLLKKKPNANIEMIAKAYVFSAMRHREQVRLSGEPYLSHPLYIANLLVEFTDDEICIVSGLLHDVFEDTDATEEEVGKIFGNEVKDLILNLHKFIKFDSRRFRKDSVDTFLIDYFTYNNIDLESSLLKKDPRILLIRMADCIHNTLMLPYMREQSYINWFLRQNLNFRIPLAKKLGFINIANQLEQLSLEQLETITPILLSAKMRCFKTGVDKCPKKPHQRSNLVFVGMPFRDEYWDIYNNGIIPAMEKLNFVHWSADEHFDNTDLMCKICYQIQQSQYAIIDLSEWNPNVLFELGLCYGRNVSVVIIKDKHKTIPTDLQGIEYIEYKHSGDLNKQLISAFNALSIPHSDGH